MFYFIINLWVPLKKNIQVYGKLYILRYFFKRTFLLFLMSWTYFRNTNELGDTPYTRWWLDLNMHPSYQLSLETHFKSNFFLDILSMKKSVIIYFVLGRTRSGIHSVGSGLSSSQRQMALRPHQFPLSGLIHDPLYELYRNFSDPCGFSLLYRLVSDWRVKFVNFCNKEFLWLR